jgi:putative nucleotidyltransferase with HDIG domain
MSNGIEAPTAARARTITLSSRALALGIPIVLSVLACIIVSRVLPPPQAVLQLVGWWVLLTGIAAITAVGAERLLRRLLPLAWLVDMSALFPDQATSRIAAVMGAGSVTKLHERLDRARRTGETSSEQAGAEKLLELIVALNTHDRGTRNHCERTRNYAELIAEELGLSPGECEQVRWAALLHDVGKIAVDPALLNAREPPSRGDLQTVRQHTEEGARLVAPLAPWLGDAVRAVGEHHEQWNGRGYPDGLAGEQISLAARIVAVADAFDMMTRPPYRRRALSMAEARAELTIAASTQFDPAVVRAFLGISLGRLRFVMGPLSLVANAPVLAGTTMPTLVGSAVSGLLLGVAALGGVTGPPGPVDDPSPAATQAAGPTDEEPDPLTAPDPTSPPATSPPSTSPPATSPPSTSPPATSPPVTVADPVDRPSTTTPNAPTLPPVGATDVVLRLPEDSVIEFTLGEPGDVVSVSRPSWGSLSTIGPGRFSYRPTPNANGTATSSYERCVDGSCASATLTIIVDPVNDAPRARDTVAATSEDTPVTVDVLASASDVEGDPLRVAGAVALGGGSATVTAGGQVRYTPAPDANGVETVRYTVADGADRTAAATLTVTVTAVNDRPSFTAGADQVVVEDAGPQTVANWATAISPGPANESTQTVSFTGVATDPALFSAQPAVSATGTLTFTPAPDANGTATITITARDDGGTANGGEDTSPGQIADITIASALDPPVAADDAYGTNEDVTLNQGAAGGLLDNDDDVDGDTLTVNTTPVTPPIDGTLTLHPGGAFDYTPDRDFNGTDTFTYRIDDGTGRTDTATVTITVTAVNDPPPATAAAGADHSCFGLADGTVWCTGDNFSGQLGTGDTTGALTPVQVVGPGGVGLFEGAADITAGNNHSCAVKDDGTVWCWGDGRDGELGDGTLTRSTTPVQVAGVGGVGFLTGAVEVAAGEDFSCAVIDDGTVSCWGEDDDYQLGNGPAGGTQAAPVQVLGPGGVGTLTGVATVGTGVDHACAVKTDGTVWCWGYNGAGRLGDGTMTASDVPVQVLGPGGVGLFTGAVAVDAGSAHSCVVNDDGTAWCWGRNSQGRLGDGTITSSRTPVQVVGPGGVGFLTGAVDIGTGRDHSCAARANGTAWCWGRDVGGQLGDGSPASNSSVPVQVVGPGGVGFLTGVTSISEGSGREDHSCAAQSTTIWCWGRNVWGQLGGGAPPIEHEPVQAV